MGLTVTKMEQLNDDMNWHLDLDRENQVNVIYWEVDAYGDLCHVKAIIMECEGKIVAIAENVVATFRRQCTNNAPMDQHCCHSGHGLLINLRV